MTENLQNTKPGGKRLGSLDSLRGLAAMTVVLHHILSLYKPTDGSRHQGATMLHSAKNLGAISSLPGTFLFELSPFHIFTAGHEAVILFFVLSGFVLFLSWKESKDHTYKRFIIRRISRIYLPYLASLLLVILLNAMLSRGGLPGMNSWFNKPWAIPITWWPVLQHVLLVDSFDTDRFSPPIWSLVHEMRISIVFPVLACLVMIQGRWSLATAVGLSSAGIALTVLFGSSNNYCLTVHYTACFILGAVLADCREVTSTFYRALSVRKRCVFFLIAFLFYTYGRVVAWIPRVPDPVADLLIATGAAMIIVWAETDPLFLRLPAAKWLGKVSYGLYLTHLGVMFACIYTLHGIVPLWLILCIAIPLALVGSELFYRFIEAPAILLGKSLTRIRQPRAAMILSSE